MSFFSRIKNKSITESIPKQVETNYETGNIHAPISGRYISLEKVPDPAFATGMLGDGWGIEPESSAVYSPASGKVVSIAETKHFVCIDADDGTSFLIHIGMDTVELKGKGFQVLVSEGQKVHCGDLLLFFDKQYMEDNNYCLTTAFIIAETAEGTSFHKM